MRLTVVRTPAGNFGRIRKGLERAGATVHEASPRSITGSERAVVLAGVSSFTTLSRSLSPAREKLRRMALGGTPLLGVCAGMQVLFASSEEGPGSGLALLPGRVRRLRARRVPNLGWSRLEPPRGANPPGRLFADIPPGSYAYFAHTYRAPLVGGAVAAETEYLGERYPSAVERSNLWGLQFHPEVSSTTGARVLQNFVALCEEAGR